MKFRIATNNSLTGLEAVGIDQDAVEGHRIGEALGVSEDDEGRTSFFERIELPLSRGCILAHIRKFSLFSLLINALHFASKGLG